MFIKNFDFLDFEDHKIMYHKQTFHLHYKCVRQ